jgi:hypothetical protein
MSRWTIAFASLAVIAFVSVRAIAADDTPPRNIEMKPGAQVPEPAPADATDTNVKTRQIVTEGKDAPPSDVSRDDAAGGSPDATGPDEAETAPPPPEPAQHAPKPPAEAAVHAPPPPPAPPPLRPEDMVFAVQTELKRVGCDPGAIDGAWGGRSREALAAFGHFAKLDVGSLAPTPEILALIKGKTEVVCAEPAPPPEQHAAPPPHHQGYGGYGGGYQGGGGY